jgi:AcrR family transcriptional regulator
MRDIAATAEVAEKTLYLTFGSKADLLRAVADQAIAGDDETVPVAERRWFSDILSDSDSRQALRKWVEHQEGALRRLSDLIETVRAAAKRRDGESGYECRDGVTPDPRFRARRHHPAQFDGRESFAECVKLAGGVAYHAAAEYAVGLDSCLPRLEGGEGLCRGLGEIAWHHGGAHRLRRAALAPPLCPVRHPRGRRPSDKRRRGTRTRAGPRPVTRAGPAVVVGNSKRILLRAVVARPWAAGVP